MSTALEDAGQRDGTMGTLRKTEFQEMPRDSGFEDVVMGNCFKRLCVSNKRFLDRIAARPKAAFLQLSVLLRCLCTCAAPETNA